MGWLKGLFSSKKNSIDVRATELYGLMIEYSKMKVNKVLSDALTDSNGNSALSNLLEYCAILYQPENYHYYAVLDEKKGTVFEQKDTRIPAWLPQNYGELVKHFISLCYQMMFTCLQGTEYLNYPNFDAMEKNIDQLCMEECMQYFLFYNRLLARYGQKHFFQKWKDGTALQFVKRMQQLQDKWPVLLSPQTEKFPPAVELKFVNEPTEEEIAEMIKKRNELLKKKGYSIKDDGTVSAPETQENSNEFQYYRFSNGIIFKVKPKEFLLYRLDSKTGTWVRDDELYTDFANVSWNYSPFEMEDNYAYAP